METVEISVALLRRILDELKEAQKNDALADDGYYAGMIDPVEHILGAHEHGN
jgi:hypothetical protein